jgi:molecular chaperone DnaK
MKNDMIRALKSPGSSKTNTFIEFKRTMGTTHTYTSSNLNKELTPDELSAEVLKKLKSFIQDENLSSIVITVPAKFLNPQNEATMKAAKLAGFKHVQLLQEPVAAATAYGIDGARKDGFWLVFDFGGGTFDAALLKSEEGILSVKDTDGDNWLGGKNLDSAIVDQIIIPNLQENFAIDSVLNDSISKEVLRNAVKPFAEETKIQLSFKDSHNILTNLGDLPFEDDNGEEPEIDVEVTQEDMERVLGPIFQKAIDISKDLLKRNNLKGSDLGALILVGGPTYSPILRRMLREQITDNVDTSVDPMTVVARGAALFASTISVSDEVLEETRDRTKLQLDINYDATTVDLEEMINIKVLKEKTIGKFPEKVYADVVRYDGAWSSGKKLIGEKAIILDVLLVEGRSNSFEVNVYDEVGNKLECQPNQFSILQGIGGLDGMQVLNYHIGIGKFFRADEKVLFLPIRGLEKNKRYPVIGAENGLKTTNVITPGKKTDIIRIPIYQGDFEAKGTNPVLNNLINEVIITGETIPSLLPIGSDVDITIKIDQSQLMQFSAYFPLIDHTEELEIQIKQTEPPTESFLTIEISKAKKNARNVNASEISKALLDLEVQLNNEKGSADGKMRILDSLRKELLKLDNAEKSAEWPKVERELKQAFFELEELIDKIKISSADGELNMEMVSAHIHEFRTKIEQVISERNTRQAKALVQEIGQVDFDLRSAVTGNAMDVQFLQHLNNEFNSFHWKNPTKARQLLNQGLQMAAAGNTSSIRPIIIQLISLMPEDERPTAGELE